MHDAFVSIYSGRSVVWSSPDRVVPPGTKVGQSVVRHGALLRGLLPHSKRRPTLAGRRERSGLPRSTRLSGAAAVARRARRHQLRPRCSQAAGASTTAILTLITGVHDESGGS